MVELTTQRLVLRAPGDADKHSLVEKLNDWEVVKWLSNVPHPYAVGDAEDWIELITAQHPNLNLSIFLDDELIGGVGLSHREDNTYELGYWLAADFWGKGITTEAAREILAYGQRELPHPQVVSSYMKGNTASAAVLEKLGFEATGEGEIYCLSRQEPVPCVHVALP